MSTHRHLAILHEYLDALEVRLQRGPGESSRVETLRLFHETASQGLDVATRLLAATDLFEDLEKEHEGVRSRVDELRALLASKVARP